MNIFILGNDMNEYVKYYVDKHVVKMILEYAQILCTVHRQYGNTNEILYKPTHIKHPCVLWAAESTANYKYLYDLFLETCKEYQYRYKKIHMCYNKILHILSEIPNIPNNKWTTPACAMPKEYIVENDVIQSYRNYYKYGKQHLMKYTGRNMPEWLL